MKNKLIENTKSKGWTENLSIVSIIAIGILMLMLPSLVAMALLPKIDIANSGLLKETSQLFRSTISELETLIISFIGIHLTIFLFVKYAEKRPYSHIGLEEKNKKLKGSIGFTLGVISIGIASLFVVILGDGGIGNTGNINVLPYIFIVLIGWGVQGSAEEFLFRGWVMPKISRRYGIIVGIMSSSIMFALAHGANPGITVLAVVNLVLFGVFTALYAIYEEGIIGVSAYHIAWNWAQGNLFGLNVSGADAGISFIKITTESENIFTGYSFGPEGGLVVTLVILMSIIILSYLLYRKKY